MIGWMGAMQFPGRLTPVLVSVALFATRTEITADAPVNRSR